jgi:hypothetical protein
VDPLALAIGRKHKWRARRWLPGRRRCSHAIGTVTAMAPIGLTTASQLRSEMLAEMLRTSKRLSKNTSSRFGERTREPAARSAPTARGTAPTATSGRRAPYVRMRNRGPLPARRQKAPVRAGCTRVRTTACKPARSCERLAAISPAVSSSLNSLQTPLTTAPPPPRRLRLGGWCFSWRDGFDVRPSSHT